MRTKTSREAALKNPAVFLRSRAESISSLSRQSKGRGWLIEPFSRSFAENSPQKESPLFGLTFAAKGNIQVAGLPCTFGLNPPAIAQCKDDSAVIKHFETKGATLIGITNLDEGCLTHLGENSHYGEIQNPTDSSLRALGTSGGSAAVVAAGLTDFALGSDYGGSIRLPAAAMGIAGLKTSPGILPHTGSFLYDLEMDTLGVLTEEVEDLFTIFEFPTSERKISQILIPSPVSLSRVDKEIVEHFKKTIDALKEKGAAIQNLPDEIFDEALSLRKLLAPEHLELLREQVSPTTPLTKPMLALLALKKRTPAEEIRKAKESVLKIRGIVTPYLEKGGVILTPSLPYLPLRSRTEDSRTPFNYFMPLANILAAPAISFPHRQYSLHLIGAPGSEKNLTQMAFTI